MRTQRRRLRLLPALLGAALVAGALAAVPAGAAPTWLAPPVTLAQGELGPADAQVVVDGAGNATAAWVMDGATVTIQAATHPVGGTWSAPVIVASGNFDSQLDLAVNAAGTAVAIWSRFTDSATVVDSAFKTPGGSWSAPVPVSDGTNDAEDPRVVVDAAGDTVATWLEDTGPAQVLRYSTRTATGPWSATDDVSVPDDGSSTDHYDLKITPSGQATAAWEFSHIADGHMVQSAVRPAGGTFGDPVRISAAGITITGVPSVAVNANGVAIVAWHQDIGTEQVKSATRAATGVWSGVQSVSAAGGWNLDPDVVIDAAGTSTAVWVRNQSMQPGKIQFSTRPAGGTWSAPQDLDTPTTGYESPALAIDPSGRITAAYVVNNPSGNDSISATTRAPGGAWTAPVPLSSLPSGTNGRSPDVAMDDAGQAVVAWLGTRRRRGARPGTGAGQAGPVSGRALDTGERDRRPTGRLLLGRHGRVVGRPLGRVDVRDGSRRLRCERQQDVRRRGDVRRLGHRHRRGRQRHDPDRVGRRRTERRRRAEAGADGGQAHARRRSTS